MGLMVSWIAIIAAFSPIVTSQVYPGSYEVSSNVISENGSSETGLCSNVADSGRVCNSPRSSVLFDGIPTLTELDGDMWARQLLTFNTAASSARISFDFTNASNTNGPTVFTGVELIELVIFNCPRRGIGFNGIMVTGGDNSNLVTINANSVSMNCSYLTRLCNTEIASSTRMITMDFNHMYERLYIADIVFYSSHERVCSQVGPIPESVITSTSADNSEGDSSPNSSTLSTSEMASSNTLSTVTILSTAVSFPAPSSSTKTIVLVVAIVITVLVVIAGVICFTVMAIMLKKKRKKYSSFSSSVQAEHPSNNKYAHKVGPEYEEMVDIANEKATIPNRDITNRTLKVTYEDVNCGEENEGSASPILDTKYEAVNKLISKQAKTGDAIVSTGEKTTTDDAEYQIYNELDHDSDKGQSMQLTVNTSEDTYSALEAPSSVSVTSEARRENASNLYSALNNVPKLVHPVANEEDATSSSEYSKLRNSNVTDKKIGISPDVHTVASPKSTLNNALGEGPVKAIKIDDIYAVPTNASNITQLSSGAIATTSYQDNPLYNTIECDPKTDNVYSEPEIQQLPSRESENIQENIYESIYSESLQPSLFEPLAATEAESSAGMESLCPYSSIYTVPIVTSQLESPLEVSVSNICEVRELGSGQFGQVILARTVGISHADLKMGTSTDKNVSIPIAVKMLKESASQLAKMQFEKEYRFMFRLNHPNVIRMLGICTEDTPFIMIEYMENGDLNQVLKHQYNCIIDSSFMPGDGEITQRTLVYICTQIASGMNYLASNNFIHRDVATRNCLVGEDFLVKIADFGMSRSLYESHYYIIKGHAILPIRWMASECFYGKFSAKSDVWAFGCTMWEIFELSKHEPYYKMTDQEMVEDAVLGAERSILSCPTGCPQSIYEIMKSCWPHEASERATFEELFTNLSVLCI